MMLRVSLCLVLVWAFGVSSFVLQRNPSLHVNRDELATLLYAEQNAPEQKLSSVSPSVASNNIFSRRRALATSVGISTSVMCSLFQSQPTAAAADDFFQDAPPPVAIKPKKDKVLVLGGTGFVGSKVVQTLQSKGVSVVSTSRDGRDGTIALDVARDNDWEGTIQKMVTDSDVTAIISCIGAIGTPDDEVVNGATGKIASVVKTLGVKRFVYITVAPEVKDFGSDIEFLKGYMKGKMFSRSSVLSTFGEQNAIFIEPTFIYGGDSFGINPPRVASFYGTFIEGLLSSNAIRSIEGILPPGIVKIALEPPVAVEDVALAAVAGALGKSASILDTYDKIKEAAKVL